MAPAPIVLHSRNGQCQVSAYRVRYEGGQPDDIRERLRRAAARSSGGAEEVPHVRADVLLVEAREDGTLRYECRGGVVFNRGALRATMRSLSFTNDLSAYAPGRVWIVYKARVCAGDELTADT